jgi:hypothetical protein
MFRRSCLGLLSCVLPAYAAPRIDWQLDRPVLIQEGGHYGRIARVDGKTLMACFDWKRAIHVRRSTDEGMTWEEPVKVAEWQFGGVTNAELLVLKNGELLCFFNRRPGNRGGSRKYQQPFSIGVSRSKDGGRTWSEPTTIYQAGSEFGNGCWEPVGLQLPSHFVLSYQQAESGDMKQSRMAVSIGSHEARNFSAPTFPFVQDRGRAQLWNSLFIKNDQTVTAVSETSQNGVHGIWAVDGILK